MDKNDSFLLFAFIFGIFGWAIWGLLKYTDDTIGKYSPLKISRSYQITVFQYFTRFENLAFYYFGLSGLYCLSKVPSTISSSVYLYDWRITAALTLLSLIMIAPFIVYLYLDLNYWQYTKSVRITYHPDEKTVEIDFPEKTYLIKEGDIRNIETVSSGGRVRFGYSIYSLINGDSFILTDRTPGTWAIQEYFKKIPFQWTEKRFPVIKR